MYRYEEVHKQCCDLCGVQYSGIASAKQHLRSKGHEKKQLMSQLKPCDSSFRPDGDIGSNEDCEITLRSEIDSQDAMSEMSVLSHQLSDVDHLEKAMMQHGLRDETTLPKEIFKREMDETKHMSHMTGVNQNGREMSPNPIHQLPLNILPSLSGMKTAVKVPLTSTNTLISPGHPQQSQYMPVNSLPVQPEPPSSSPTPEYVFDGSRGRCNVCGIDFTSRPHADSHLAGSKHQKAKQRWNLKSQSSPHVVTVNVSQKIFFSFLILKGQ